AGKPTDDGDATRLSSPTTAATDNVTNDETHLGAPDINTHSTPGSDSEGPQPEPPPSGGAVARQTETDLPAGGVHLPIGYMLRDYKITGLLGQGGFGITYLAQDTIFNSEVVIKENMPTAISNRNTTTFCVQALTEGTGPGSYEWALNNFLNEARILSQLEHPNIIKIKTAFREMGTAYYVMPYISGTSLDKVSMPMAEAEIRTILMAMLDALEYLHSRTPILLHRDIKPANILLTPDGTPILIDFGTARVLTEHSQTSIESAGYTPFEQLQTGGNLGPWTDIYALGATVFCLITGSKPMKSTDRMGRSDRLVPLAGRPDLQKDYSPQLLLSVDRAMALWPEDRWQNVAEWRQALATPLVAAPEVNAEPTPQSKPQTTPQKAPVVANEKSAEEAGKQPAPKKHSENKAPVQATGSPRSPKKASSEQQQEEPKIVKKATTPQDQKKVNDALLEAAREGNAECVRQLLDRGADIEAKDKDGETALIRAAWYGKTEVVSLLLDRGADIEAKDKYGYTPLIKAAEEGKKEVVSLLLDRGADIEAKDEFGYTALIKAAKYGKTKVVSLLLDRGADIEAKDKYDYTALIKAVGNGKTEVVRLLLDRGADIEAK
ncbi:MAG: ankyrin repeat domain-containing protein, partial [Akkermansia sp.]